MPAPRSASTSSGRTSRAEAAPPRRSSSTTATARRSTAADIDALLQRLRDIDHVSSSAAPRVSADGDTALVNIQYDVPTTDPDLVAAKGYDPLEDAIEPLRDAGLQAELGGELPGSDRVDDEGHRRAGRA